MTNLPADPIPLAGTLLDRHRHACAFFENADQEQRVLGPFVKDGIDRGEKAFHIIDPDLRATYMSHLQAAGIDMELAIERGQFELRAWEDAYLRPGYFDQQEMLSLVQAILEDAKKQGYPLTRAVAHMEWALQDLPGVDDLVEYEAKLNAFLPNFPDPVICVYDTGKFTSGTIIDILRTHPVVILGDTVRENPFYIPPDEFLAELRRRTGDLPA